MKRLDRWLQAWRIARARRYVPWGARVLDIGCSDGALFRQLGGRIGEGVGLDPDLPAPVEGPGYRLLPGGFPEGLGNEQPFDVITMLAVLEHIPPARQTVMAHACAENLKPGGYLVITTPAAAVDSILAILLTLRVIDGMAVEEHYGFQPSHTPGIFTPHGLALVEARKFQLGLNNLFVFRKSFDAA